MKTENLSRRRFLGTGLMAAAGIALASKSSFAASFLTGGKPNSMINGVQIGVITYSFRSMPGSAEQLLQYCKDCNINAIELMGEAAEAFAGAPKYAPNTDWQAKMAEWRSSVPMDKFKELRKMYNDAGVKIYAWKPNALNKKNTDAEIDYAFNAGKALGCTHVTVELPEDHEQTQRLGNKAAEHKMFVGYHAHTQATDTAWDTALGQSPYNSMNLDCGHYIAAGGNNTAASLLALIEAKHERITTMHIKDRKTKDNGGVNMPWGQGNTPVKEILTLLKDKKYKIPATIELEYDIPAGSDAVKETQLCVAFAKQALNA